MADMAKVFKALSDPTRLAIFELVRDCNSDGCSDDQVSDNLTEIAERFGLSLSTVSHHVKELRQLGAHHLREARTAVSTAGSTPRCCSQLEAFAKGSAT